MSLSCPSALSCPSGHLAGRPLAGSDDSVEMDAAPVGHPPGTRPRRNDSMVGRISDVRSPSLCLTGYSTTLSVSPTLCADSGALSRSACPRHALGGCGPDGLQSITATKTNMACAGWCRSAAAGTQAASSWNKTETQPFQFKTMTQTCCKIKPR